MAAAQSTNRYPCVLYSEDSSTAQKFVFFFFFRVGVHRCFSFLDAVHRHAIVVSAGEVAGTSQPYWLDDNDQTRTLDYWCCSKPVYSIVHEAGVEPDVTLKSKHLPVGVDLRLCSSPASAQRRPYAKRRWPGWREAPEGQYNALPPPQSWRTMTAVETDICRAGKLGAAATPSGFATPFDHLEKGLIQAKRTQHHPEARKTIQRGILQVRRQQHLWRAAKRITEATSQGRNLARPRDQVSRPIMLILGRDAVDGRTEAFLNHWKGTMTTPTEQVDDRSPQQDLPMFDLDATDFQDAIPVPASHEGVAAAVDLELLVKVCGACDPVVPCEVLFFS